MKKIIVGFIFLFVFSLSYTQVKLDDFGRIILNSYLSDKIELSSEVKNALLSKLDQISSSNGMGGSQVNPRFIITASIIVGSKDVIAGPPQMIAQNIDISLFIGDAIENTIYSTFILKAKGVGTNENKAFIDALNSINPKNKDISDFILEGKTKIINYYSSKCDFILKDAQSLVNQDKYDEAIYKLSIIPDVCKDCYFKCQDTLSSIYQKKFDNECKNKLTQAKSVWGTQQTQQGAEKALEILSQIKPSASCQSDVKSFLKLMNDKLIANEKAEWDFKMKQYKDNLELEKLKTNSYKEVAIEYLKTQPKSVTYNNVYWR